MTSQDDPNANPEKNDQLSACSLPSNAKTSASESFRMSEDAWRDKLTSEQFRVMRKHGTEPPFKNAYWNNKDKGIYLCAGCEAPLFSSGEKYDSHSGWPSFWETIEPQHVGRTVDESHGMVRTEVHCSRCGGHLGHVFDDGPRPTGLRYCINSASIEFVPKTELDRRELSQYSDLAK